jgi:hypothetical protein
MSGESVVCDSNTTEISHSNENYLQEIPPPPAAAPDRSTVEMVNYYIEARKLHNFDLVEVISIYCFVSWYIFSPFI